jgi:hypothetical protein
MTSRMANDIADLDPEPFACRYQNSFSLADGALKIATRKDMSDGVNRSGSPVPATCTAPRKTKRSVGQTIFRGGIAM